MRLPGGLRSNRGSGRPAARHPSLSNWRTPRAVTVTVYPDAGGSAAAVKTPAALVASVRTIPLDWFETTTLALATEALDASRTTPEIPASPAADWANAAAEPSTINAAERRHVRIHNFVWIIPEESN